MSTGSGVPAHVTHAARRELHEGWTVRPVAGPAVADREIPAAVPGSIHTDLLAAGLIDDPYLDDNEALLAWIGRCDWEYRTTFSWSDDWSDDGAAEAATRKYGRHDLAFDGLDTVATVTLNGTEVASTRNQHRTYRVAVDGLLREGANELVVRFASPVRHADRESLALGYRPQAGNRHPFNAIRKAACNFGWDWGIDAATVGIWRPVALESWTTARLAAVRPLATVERAEGTDRGTVAVHVDVERAPGQDCALDLEASVTGPDGRDHAATVTVPAGVSTAVVHVEVPGAQRWWPRGYGEQPLYDVAVRLRTGTTVLSDWSGRIGFRTVRLEMEPDEHGTSFAFVVNDEPVWIRGANWIPDDVFVHRVTRERYAARIAQAEQANMNLLRVWGGGIYEADDFYDLCDERGMLTWQDFTFACAAYAEEEPLRSEVEAEARDNVTRLAPHPSLVLWNGNNENNWGFHDWNWELRLQGRTWGLGYYTELFPRVLAELDPDRPYTPSSPWSGSLDVHPNDPDHGSMHSWELWNRKDYPHYRDTVPRFMAEFGWQGPPTWSTLTRAVSDDPLTPESPGMTVHQKAAQGNDKLTDGLVRHLPLPGDMEDWHWAMSLNQATAVQVALEHLRSWSPRCRGAVVWQLNDCWPVTSWAAVDGDGQAKPLLYSIKHAYADRLLTIQPRGAGGGVATGAEDDGLAVVAVNDTGEGWSSDVVVRRVAYDGTELATTTVPVRLAARGRATVVVPAEVATPGDRGRELLVARLGDARATWFFAEPRDSALVAPRLRTEVRETDGAVEVTVSADDLVRDLALLVDKVQPGAVVDDMLVTLLPEESVTFHVALPAGPVPDPSAFVSPRVLRTANQLVVDRA